MNLSLSKPRRNFLFKLLNKHMGPGNHPNGSPQSVHDPKFEGKGTLKEKAQLRHILKFKGKNGEKVYIEKVGNHWVVQIKDKDGNPLSKSYASYSKAQLIKSGNLAVQDIEAEIWKKAPPPLPPVPMKGIKARLRAIGKFKHEGRGILLEKNGGTYQVAIKDIQTNEVIAGSFQTFKKREEAVTYAEQMMSNLKLGNSSTPLAPSISPPSSPHDGSFKDFNNSSYPNWVGKSAKHWDQDSRQAIKAYGDGSYTPINKYHRRGIISADSSKDKILQYTKGLDDAFMSPGAEAPSNLIVWRGMNPGDDDKLKDFWLGTVGSDSKFTVSDPGYMSTSVDSKFAGNWGKGGSFHVYMEVEVPKGSNVLPLGSYSGHSSEKEVLFPRGSKFLIVNSTRSDFGIKTQIKVKLRYLDDDE